MKSKKTILILGALLLASTPAWVQAQGPIPPYVAVHIDEIDPGQTNAYEANAAEWVAAFTEAELGWEYGWDGYNSDFTYAWVSGMPNFAFLDGNEERQAAAAEAIGAEEMEALLAGASGGVSHYTEVWKFEPELSHMVEGYAPSGAAVNVGVQWVKPSADSEYRAVVKEAIAAIAKTGAQINFIGYSIPMGRGSYAYVSWGETRAALHSGPEMGAVLGQALGAEGAQALFQRWTDTIVKVEERDWRVRPDLSYAPAAAEEEMAAEEGDE